MATVVATKFESKFNADNPYWQPYEGYNRAFLSTMENHINDKMKADGFIFLNDVYSLLGLPRTQTGQVVGWIAENRDRFHIEIFEHPDDTVTLYFEPDGYILDKVLLG